MIISNLNKTIYKQNPRTYLNSWFAVLMSDTLTKGLMIFYEIERYKQFYTKFEWPSFDILSIISIRLDVMSYIE